MQNGTAFSELVRCVGCHAVYEQAVLASDQPESAACPHCGEAAWLAARVPVHETAETVPA